MFAGETLTELRHLRALVVLVGKRITCGWQKAFLTANWSGYVVTVLIA